MRKPVPRVAAIHDLSGFGRASLTVVIPILSTLGIQVCPLPTAVLSTHSMFPDYRFIDLTEHMREIIEHWKKLEIDFDAIYSGFLGSPEQIDIVTDFIDTFSQEETLIVVDPVLGDNGALYGPLNQQMVQEMRRLIGKADLITPNITEMALLLDTPYRSEIAIEEVKRCILELSERGPDTVIVTSVSDTEDPGRTAVIAYNRQDGRFWRVSCNYVPATYPGTGDAFTSVVTGSLLQGDSLPIAMDRAMQFTSMGIRATFGHSYKTIEGILLERVLEYLQVPVPNSTYELV